MIIKIFGASFMRIRTLFCEVQHLNTLFYNSGYIGTVKRKTAFPLDGLYFID